MKKIGSLLKIFICAIAAFACSVEAGTVTIIGNGAGTGTIMVTSAGTNIGLGTQVRIGTFNNSASLSSAIADYLAGTANFATTLSALNSNFIDLGTNVTNYGNSVQTGTGVAADKFVIQGTTTALSVNGVSGQTWNIFNGSIGNVNYTSGIGTGKNLYAWVSFNNELGIVRNADGTGTANWVTPTSDLSGVTMNLSALSSSEVLLGTYVDYAAGSDLIKLQAAIPEPASGSLVLLAGACVLALRRLRKV
jgi:hypothetical protein